MSELISSNYLDPVEYQHNMEINLRVEVYLMHPDWGGMGINWESGEAVYFEPYYKGTLNGLVTSANLSVDSTSDMRTTGSFSIIIEENSVFIPHLEDNYYWHDKNLKVIKTYTYPDSGGYTEEFTVGWFVPNEGSYTYNVETREFSMSCTDLLSYYTETRGGHLSDSFESRANMSYRNATTDCFDSDGHSKPIKNGEITEDGESTLTYGEKIANSFNEDLTEVARYSSGLLLEGEKNNTQNDVGQVNIFEPIRGEVNGIWQGKFETYKSDNGELQINGADYGITTREFNDTNSLVKALIRDYGHACEYYGVNVDLQNGYEMLPYDIEINADTTLYDVLKKITDLYPNQFIYFDTNRTWNIVQKRRSAVVAHARDFIEAVTDEHWNIDLSDIKNFTVVWGRDESCLGFFYVNQVQYICENCGKREDVNINKSTCGYCGGALKSLYFGTNGCSIQMIGAHKQVIYDDNILTDKEACDEAKALTYQNCRGKKTLSVTLGDYYLDMYSRPDIGVGDLIEYKSKLSGETGLYTVNKWSNNFEDGSVTLELEPYFSYTEDISTYYSDGNYSTILNIPTFTYTVENGLLTMIINNGADTSRSLFKVYYTVVSHAWDGALDGTELDIVTTSFQFLGETCTDDGNGNKIFQYKFKKSGTYFISCQAWNPDTLPSSMPNFVGVNISVVNESFIPPLPDPEKPDEAVITQDDVYISSMGYYFTNENGEYYVKS